MFINKVLNINFRTEIIDTTTCKAIPPIKATYY